MNTGTGGTARRCRYLYLKTDSPSGLLPAGINVYLDQLPVRQNTGKELKTMRRKDRKVTNREEIRKVLDECKVCRLGMIADGKPYIVPMNMGCDYDGEKLVLYFHCAKEGKKLKLLGGNAQVGFEMDKEIALAEGDTPCQYSYHFMSIIGSGQAELVEDETEKAEALAKIMRHQTGKDFDDFDKNPKLSRAVTVIKVTAEEYSCKQNLPAN